jgi:hypothetical protein
MALLGFLIGMFTTETQRSQSSEKFLTKNSQLRVLRASAVIHTEV